MKKFKNISEFERLLKDQLENHATPPPSSIIENFDLSSIKQSNAKPSKIIELIKKYKVYILAALLIVFFFKSCSKSSNIKKLERTNVELRSKVDSYESKIDSFPEILRKEKLSIYLSLDDTISRVDRGPQLMQLHKMIKDSVKSLRD